MEPGVQIVTLTQGLLKNPAEVMDEQSEPFTVKGITLMAAAVPPTTVSVVDPDTFPDLAVIVVVPVETKVDSPLKPAILLIVATDVDVELHVTAPVKFCVVLLEKVPVAINFCVVPRAILSLAGVTEMDTSIGAGALDPPPELPHPASSVTISKRRVILFDVTDRNSLRDKCRRISTAF